MNCDTNQLCRKDLYIVLFGKLSWDWPVKLRKYLFIATFQPQPNNMSESFHAPSLSACTVDLPSVAQTTLVHPLAPTSSVPTVLPSELEASSIRQAITQAKKDQERLTREIAQLQATMDALCDQSNTVDTFISEHEAVLAPARRILPEILSEIFLWCFADGSKLRSAKDAPIVLGQVCSYWRSVAISTPNLWSSLIFTSLGECTVQHLAGEHRAYEISCLSAHHRPHDHST
jgi:hypothetical protein